MENKALAELAISVNSGLTPLRGKKEFWETGTIPWLKTEQLGEKYIYDTNEKTTQVAIENTGLKLNPPNTICIAMYGEGRTRGSVSIIKKEMATNQACCNVVLDEQKAYFEYVYYFIKTQYNQLRALSSGVRKNLNSSDIKNFRIRLPAEVGAQKKIADVLSALDNKIDLNNRINAELEAMAKALYHYWFVQFDFPDENGKPYKSSGGKMEYDFTLKQEIPSGWRVENLGTICDLYQPKTISEKEMTIDGAYLVYGAGGIVGRYNKYNHEQSVVIISCRGSCGNISITIPFSWITGNAMVVKPRNEYINASFIYNALRSHDLKKTVTGSVQRQITRSNLDPLKICVPPQNILDKFSCTTNPNLALSLNNFKENQQLAQLRDWLLPMLMNGQVKIKGAEE